MVHAHVGCFLYLLHLLHAWGMLGGASNNNLCLHSVLPGPWAEGKGTASKLLAPPHSNIKEKLLVKHAGFYISIKNVLTKY